MYRVVLAVPARFRCFGRKKWVSGRYIFLLVILKICASYFCLLIQFFFLHLFVCNFEAFSLVVFLFCFLLFQFFFSLSLSLSSFKFNFKIGSCAFVPTTNSIISLLFSRAYPCDGSDGVKLNYYFFFKYFFVLFKNNLCIF